MESLGTHDLEAGMRPSRARAFIPVMAITVALLFVFNSAGLVRWTQNLPPSQLGTALSDAANVWHDAMTWAGPARLFEVLKETLGVELR
ncbi:hypothetical protein [Vineibacter terrae]|uniref:hypothetical protein n=1 Tax=Vineibacter terrae TaxID=2586908 RepID=UPI002E3779D6|nr:hypothetical protein [Vineibacter terrae]HEX2886793.1 hypothetical protein [Vineibacter terrae]